MPKPLLLYVKYVDYVSKKFGQLAMLMIFVMISVLLIDAFTRNIIQYPMFWCVEMAQFTMTAYYIVGGPYSMMLGDHVRMDLIYERCSEKTKAWLDVATSGCLLFYLTILLLGSISSTIYAIETNQKKFSMWNPSMVPIKVIMVGGITLMLLQAISMLIKDFAKARGHAITHEGERPTV